MIKTGKITDLNGNYKEWFIGAFVKDSEFNTEDSGQFEVKWSNQKKGSMFPLKEKVVDDPSCKSMAILIKGKFQYSFLKEDGSFDDKTMSEEGDYVYWTPDIKHKVEAFEDSVILTIRWYNKK